VKNKQYFEQERIAGASKAVLGAATRVREAATDESYKSLDARKLKEKIKWP
jgi:hypothetical protein